MSKEGKDISECLFHNLTDISCKTVTYIMSHRCLERRILSISLNSQDVYKEPCWKADQDKFKNSYACDVILFGWDTGNLPKLTCAFDNEVKFEDSTNIFSLFLSSTMTNSHHCSNYSTSNQSTLQISNLILTNIKITSRGQQLCGILANNVKFITTSFVIDPEEQNGCFVFCESCTFIGNGLAVITSSRCLHSAVVVKDSHLLSAHLTIFFVFDVDFLMVNTTISGYETADSKVTVKQMKPLDSNLKNVC